MSSARVWLVVEEDAEDGNEPESKLTWWSVQDHATKEQAVEYVEWIGVLLENHMQVHIERLDD